jgi:hypothetical protein
MSPYKQRALGIAGYRLARGRTAYLLKDGTPTDEFAVSVSLLHAEPGLRRLSEATAISEERASERGYRFVRSYEEAAALGVA